ncbi:MAG: LemA family protein [Candidatus Auribacterota bacterium]|jgi:LemA protein|uniref:LemA family protein n=1 Tax=Candidatus Auribacter fodinae TaxID=2093366 RepID=A0A3A4QPF5_9BACT|nr:MAG: LemA family protein [Candidatus Auribacter fodinae]
MWIIIAAIAVPVLFIIIMYNSLVGKKNKVNNTFASIDVMLKKRYDLIPNLVAAVKNYMKHEKSTLTEITELRAKAISPNISDEEKVDLDNKITGALGGIMVAVENYPDLKANQNFLQLQGAINEVEEQISAARRAYNATVTDYNNAVEMFPTNIMASMMKYKQKPFFAIPETERANVNVNQLFE